MRAYSIALFFLCLQVSSIVLNLTGVFTISEVPSVDTSLIDHINNTYYTKTYMNGTEISDNSEFERAGVGDTLKTFGKALSVKHTLANLGLDNLIATYISYLVYFVYILGAIQLVLLRKGMGDVS